MTVHLTKGFLPRKVSEDLESNQLCTYVRQLQMFSVDTDFGDFIVHSSIAALKFFKENLSTNKHCVLPGFTCFHVFRNRASLLVFSRLQSVWGHLQNEWVKKLLGNIPKVAHLSALSPVFSSCIIYVLFVEIPRYPEFLSQILVKLRTTEDKHPKYRYRQAFLKKMPIRAAIQFRANTIVTSLSRDFYSDRPKNNIIIKFSLCVIHVL